MRGRRANLRSAGPALLASLTHLIEQGLIVDIDSDHYSEALEAVAKVRGSKWMEKWEVRNLEFQRGEATR